MERPVKIDGTYRNTAEGQTVPARTRALTRSDEVAIELSLSDGTRFRPIEKIIHRTEMFLVKGQDLNMRLSAPSAYEWFNTTKETLQMEPHFSGNTQAY